jgi:hypothetical protein
MRGLALAMMILAAPAVAAPKEGYVRTSDGVRIHYEVLACIDQFGTSTLRNIVLVDGRIGREFSIVADHAGLRHWDGLTNGEPVTAAVGAGFTAILTRDRQFGESASRALRCFPAFSVVLVTLPQLRGPVFLERFHEEWTRQPVQPIPGSLAVWPSHE